MSCFHCRVGVGRVNCRDYASEVVRLNKTLVENSSTQARDSQYHTTGSEGWTSLQLVGQDIQ